jgi:hypothetical protein
MYPLEFHLSATRGLRLQGSIQLQRHAVGAGGPAFSDLSLRGSLQRLAVCACDAAASHQQHALIHSRSLFNFSFCLFSSSAASAAATSATTAQLQPQPPETA